MRRNHHPAYYSLADQLDQEELRARRNVNPYLHNYITEETNFFKRLIRSEALPFVVSLVACISVCILWYLYLNQNPSKESVVSASTIIETRNPSTKAESRDIEHDVTLMKDVLRSLVTTVDRLSQQNQPTHEAVTSDDTEYKSAPFKITAEKANLREYPSRESLSVSAVPKDTILMGVGFSNGWIKTFAPNGKEVWVHSSITSKIESGK